MFLYPKTQTHRILSPLRLAFWKAIASGTGLALKRRGPLGRALAHLPLLPAGVVAFYVGRFVGDWIVKLLL